METEIDATEMPVMRPQRGFVANLERTGLVANRIGPGREYHYRATGLDQALTLGTLMWFAESCVAPIEKTKGRRATVEGSREVQVINDADWRRIITAANAVAKHLHPSHAGLRGTDLWDCVTDATLWAWDATGGPGGAGGWSRMDQVVAKTTRRESLAQYRGSLNLLLDLAATHGVVPRTERHGGERWVIPTTWTDTQQRWMRLTKRVRGYQTGVNALIKAAAYVLGPDVDLAKRMRDEATANRVLDHLRAQVLGATTLSVSQRGWVRQTVRALMDAGELPHVIIDRWDLRQHDSFKLWPVTWDNAIAEAHRNDWDGRAAAWKKFPYAGLADASNPFSLRCAVDWFAAEDRDGRGKTNVFPRAAPRKSGNGDTWSPATVLGNMTIFSYFFGVLRRYTNLDLNATDLRQAFTEENARLVVRAVKDGAITPRMGRDCLIYMGLLSSPYLEREALAAGDTLLADRFFELSAFVSGQGKITRTAEGGIRFDGVCLRDSLGAGQGKGKTTRQASREGKAAKQRQKAAVIQATYERVLGVEFAYEGMIRIYQAAQKTVLADLGVASVAALRARWEDIQPTRTQLIALRDVTYWNDALAAPMRARATSEQTMEMRALRLDGSLRLETPACIHKVPENGDYIITLHKPSAPGGYDLEMWELYRDLVRPALMCGVDGDAVWVNDQRSGGTEYVGVSESNLNIMIRHVLDLAGPELGYQGSAAFEGARSTHCFRHAVGSYYVNNGMAHIAAILLHHKGTDMLMHVYSHQTATASTAGARAEIQQRAEQASEAAEQSIDADELAAFRAWQAAQQRGAA